MAIEIKQMVIKSNVIQRSTDDTDNKTMPLNVEQLKESVLTECRRIVLDLLNARKDR